MEMKETVKYIAELARLSYSEEEIETFGARFDKILNYIETINALDLEGVEPLTHVIDTSNVFRADEARPSLPLEEALANAPKRNENFFKAPKAIE